MSDLGPFWHGTTIRGIEADATVFLRPIPGGFHVYKWTPRDPWWRKVIVWLRWKGLLT
jgi:hypothetical protein